eukprot:TRINITY_DN34983_c0_g1_i1.p1 TRINITY_DN34983_c0_g1~~TRINITY_DN34983_c0_g1_i1.p1  ORF type:complete len:329 (-),score=88.53 TRINITY_DN34983_c0_g1_i1:49-1035(-)
MIRRPPRSTLSSSSAASDVYKRQEPQSPLEEDHEPAQKRLKRSVPREGRFHGVVDAFDPRRGWGFIRPDESEELVFVHYSAIRSERSRKHLKQGQRVGFSEAAGRQGVAAADVLVEGENWTEVVPWHFDLIQDMSTATLAQQCSEVEWVLSSQARKFSLHSSESLFKPPNSRFVVSFRVDSPAVVAVAAHLQAHAAAEQGSTWTSELHGLHCSLVTLELSTVEQLARARHLCSECSWLSKAPVRVSTRAQSTQTGDGEEVVGVVCDQDAHKVQVLAKLVHSTFEHAGFTGTASCPELSFKLLGMKPGAQASHEIYLSLIHISEPTRPY